MIRDAAPLARDGGVVHAHIPSPKPKNFIMKKHTHTHTHTHIGLLLAVIMRRVHKSHVLRERTEG